MSISRSASSCFSSPQPGAVSALPDEGGGSEIVGCSASMRRLRLQVRRIAPHFRTVLVSGEAGTGKELVARTLHAMSPVANGPFVVCHAAALSEALTEYEPRTRSTNAFDALMHKSRGGTLFLDEVSEMSSEAQWQLVCALEKYESAEGPQEVSPKTTLRLIAATGEDLKILVSTGRFQQELYQRLATVDISLRPLRERMDDLPALARFFLDKFAMLYGRCVHEITDETMEQMQRCRWPGNVRELETVMRRGVLQSDGDVLELHHLLMLAETSEPICSSSAGESVRLQDVVERHVLRVLKDYGGNKLRAAEVLGISRSTLYRMLESRSLIGALR